MDLISPNVWERRKIFAGYSWSSNDKLILKHGHTSIENIHLANMRRHRITTWKPTGTKFGKTGEKELWSSVELARPDNDDDEDDADEDDDDENLFLSMGDMYLDFLWFYRLVCVCIIGFYKIV